MLFICILFILFFIFAPIKIQVTMERALVIHLLSEWTLIWKTLLESYNL